MRDAVHHAGRSVNSWEFALQPVRSLPRRNRQFKDLPLLFRSRSKDKEKEQEQEEAAMENRRPNLPHD
jgi:hypothetical protein